MFEEDYKIDLEFEGVVRKYNQHLAPKTNLKVLGLQLPVQPSLDVLRVPLLKCWSNCVRAANSMRNNVQALLNSMY